MNQYRCETCTKQGCHYHPNNNYWKDLSNGLLHFFYDSIDNVGCASHSDFQSEQDKVLEKLEGWVESELKKDYTIEDIRQYGFSSVLVKLEELRQQAGEP
jgi:hypothetical protein